GAHPRRGNSWPPGIIQRGGAHAPVAADGGTHNLAAHGGQHPRAAAIVSWARRCYPTEARMGDRWSSDAAVKLEIDRLIAAIDDAITDQVNAVIHHPRFQTLEASWRNLRRLVEGADQNTRIKIKLLDISWVELCRDLQRAIEFDRTHLFRKIYEE